MTPQEALNRIDGLIANEKLFIKISTMGEIDHSKNIEALEIAKQALEKQMPNKIETNEYYPEDRLCPVCHENYTGLDCMTSNGMKFGFCPNCGQALDWG